MISQEEQPEVTMIPLTEVGSIKWTDARGQKMRELRGDIPLMALAKRLTEFEVDISRQYLNRIETNTEVKNVSPELITALCQVFGCTLAELLCLKSTKIVQLGIDNCN
ncbi:helix-turn-helix transcriptional regulator (plasmid) [Nostoc sp. UHCC 0302]|uniref:helix-turn-helix domain-containing protein n=1 Tax=Nostoc sp. UHCC 0302 TaxID=3134896 RepID=UPI00311C92E8